MTKRGIGIRRRPTLDTDEGVRTVDWEARPNPYTQVAQVLQQAVGDRFSRG